MTRDDDPTQPLPAADGSAEQADSAPTEPMVAPHVPVADLGTDEMADLPAPIPRRSSGVKRILIVGLSAVAAAVVGVLLLSTLPRGEAPTPVESSSPPVAPSPTVSDGGDDRGPDPAPVPPPQPEPDPEPEPEPTQTPEPTVEPTPEPTP